jgi:G3E family GTPase
MSSSLIPVHVLTGFLGSGKTSLLRKLLSDPRLADTAVLINEFGEVGLDHLLVRGLTEDVVLLSSGCVCCALSDDLSSTLADLCRARMAGEIPAFARVVLETTGLADPLPIIRLLRMDSRLKSFFAVGQVVTTVDAVNALHTMEIYGEAVQQVAAADSLIITKTDMATEVEIERILRHIIAINPTARRLSYGRSDQPDSNELFARSGESRDRTGLVSLQQSDHLATSAGISSFVITLDKSVDLETFIDWLDLLLASRGDSILRVKGYLAANGYHTPLLIQGVQHILDRPEPMKDSPESAPPTQLVFIAKHVTKTAIERSIKSLLATSCN